MARLLVAVFWAALVAPPDVGEQGGICGTRRADCGKSVQVGGCSQVYYTTHALTEHHMARSYHVSTLDS